VKPGFEPPISSDVYRKTVEYFTELLHLLHPFMPFITEEIYHLLQERKDDLCVRQFASLEMSEGDLLKQGQLLKETISGLRDTRNKSQIKPKDEIRLFIETRDTDLFKPILDILARQVNASAVEFAGQPAGPSITTVLGKDKFFLETAQGIDTGNQRDEMLKELEYLRGFLISVEKKLSNERYVQNAKPEIVELEKRKKADAQIKIKTLEESLTQ
jgi:valyl-tRNA synthetase